MRGGANQRLDAPRSYQSVRGAGGAWAPPLLFYYNANMIRSLLFYALLAAAAAPGLRAQSVPAPVIPLLETVWSGTLPWQPNWPVSVPPDAFRLIRGSCSAVTLSVPGGELRFARGGGRLTAFPVFHAGTWRQVRVQTGPGGRILSLTLTGDDAAGFPDERIEILEERDSLPFMARYTGADAVYFAVFQFSGRSAAETWYSGEGEALKVRSFRYEDGGRRIRSVEEDGEAGWNYDYDAFGNVSGVRAGSGGEDFSARYVREERPRYWEGPLSLPALPRSGAEAESLPPEDAASGGQTGGIPPAIQLSLQWDERGLLTALNRDSGGEEGALAGVRYEYSLDSQGNWTERREFFMVRRGGFLIALPGETLRRRIEYSGGNG